MIWGDPPGGNAGQLTALDYDLDLAERVNNAVISVDCGATIYAVRLSRNILPMPPEHMSADPFSPEVPAFKGGELVAPLKFHFDCFITGNLIVVGIPIIGQRNLFQSPSVTFCRGQFASKRKVDFHEDM